MQNTLITIALRGITVLPRMRIYLDMNRPMSIAAATNAQKTNQNVFLVAQKDPSVENPGQEQLEQFGVIAQVKQIIKGPEDSFRVLVTGLQSAKLESIEEYVPNLIARVTVFESEKNDEQEILADDLDKEDQEKEIEEEAKIRVLKDLIEQYCRVQPKASRELANLLLQHMDVGGFCALIACNLPMKQQERQKYLAAYPDEEKRYEFILEWLSNETLVERFRAEYQSKVKNALDKQQRDYILREQMRLIRKELGEGAESAADRYEKQLKELKAPEEVKKQLEKEIKRLRSNPMDGPESKVSQNYIETLLEMPWEERTKEHISIRAAREELDKDHYGLEKVKEQVLEFLAVRQLQMNAQEADKEQEKTQPRKGGRILCLVGPPGTGKTSIARSIAKATNKKYIRLSLGGVRDESEIRGHRKTYVGAMPGRIVEALKKVKVRNPLMLLDEIDKTGKDQRGDTASALLEVLDPEQNEHFTDHYLEVALNLSDVLFVATANDLSTIPRPLLDRMEIIEVSSYTENEKYHIANDYLVKKQMEANGLNDTQIHWKEDALRFLITDYTREAGVRNLERRIGQVSRKVTRDIYQKKHRKVTITKKVIKDYLGRPVYEWEKDTLRDHVGIVHGLAWTAVGGVTLKIEVNVMPGKGAIQVTGSLGNVMKESAQAAISYIRSQSRKYKIKQDFFEKHDIHIHIPEGAVPKDGPSAGITMTTAVLSAITGNKVCGNLAMTGEVTIRGDVLMIGGLKEKLLAAKRLGITKVLVPKSNEKDVKEFEEEVVEGLEIVYVKTMTQVIKEAFVH